MINKKDIAFFFDIDGTLVDTVTGVLNQASMKEIGKLRELGYPCCLASGRSFDSAFKNTEVFDYDWDCFIGMNGVQIINEKREAVKEIFLDEKIVRQGIALANSLGHTIAIETEKGMFLLNETNEFFDKSVGLFHLKKPLEKATYNGQSVFYLCVFAPYGYDYKEYEQLGLYAARSYYPYSDIVPKGISKAETIKEYLKELGCTKYIAAGDALNDWDMLKGSYIGISMKNGDPKLSEISDIVADRIENDGLAKVLKEIREKLENE